MTVSEAREQFRPNQVKVLFIAEAPPYAPDRFFYFTDVRKGDSLFLHLIREVFPDLKNEAAINLRNRKEELLYRFQEDGFYLEDSIQHPLPKGTSAAQKLKLIIEGQEVLNSRIASYKNTKVVLLSSTVFKANYDYLSDLGYTILNDTAIPFPGSGQQTNFKNAFQKIDVWG